MGSLTRTLISFEYRVININYYIQLLMSILYQCVLTVFLKTRFKHRYFSTVVVSLLAKRVQSGYKSLEGGGVKGAECC